MNTAFSHLQEFVINTTPITVSSWNSPETFYLGILFLGNLRKPNLGLKVMDKSENHRIIE